MSLRETDAQRFAATRSGELRNCVFSAKIKFLAKEKREFSTFLAISCNRCWQMPFILSVITVLFFNPFIITFRSSIYISRITININRISIYISQIVINTSRIAININTTSININAESIYITAKQIYIIAVAININRVGSFMFLFVIIILSL